MSHTVELDTDPRAFPQEEELRTRSARLAELDARLNLDRPAERKEKHMDSGCRT